MEVILSPLFLATEGTENTEHNDQMKKKQKTKSERKMAKEK
jgi:hypothetical protein